MILERPDFKLRDWYERPENIIYFENYAKWIVPRVFGRVLDLGCGLGYLTKTIAQKENVVKVVGIDRMFENQPRVDTWQYDPKIIYLTLDILDLLGKSVFPEKFDCIVATEFVEHIPEENLDKLFLWIKDNLEKGGLFLGSTPDVSDRSQNPFHLMEYSLNDFRDRLKQYFDEIEIENIGMSCMVWQAKKSL